MSSPPVVTPPLLSSVPGSPPTVLSEAPAAATSAQQMRALVGESDPFSEATPAHPPVTPSLSELLGAELAGRVTAKLSSNLSSELQQELAAQLALLLPVLTHLGGTELELLRTAVMGLVAETPNLEYARGLREALEAAVKQKTALLRLPNLAARSPSALVAIGLGVFTYVAIPLIVYSFMPWFNGSNDAKALRVLSFPAMDFLLVCVAGAMGSVTSIIMRVREFEARKGSGPVDLILFGFFKPFMGMFFGLFCYAIFNSDLIPEFTITPNKQDFFHFSLAFIAGFSERFARDIASQTQPGLKQAEPPAPSSHPD